LEDVEGLKELQESIPSMKFKIGGGEDTIWSTISKKENEIKETNSYFKETLLFYLKYTSFILKTKKKRMNSRKREA
jgi:hypothetical protein